MTQLKPVRNPWQKTLWKIVSNPTFEVVVAMIVVMFSAWFVVQSDVFLQHSQTPLYFGHR